MRGKEGIFAAVAGDAQLRQADERCAILASAGEGSADAGEIAKPIEGRLVEGDNGGFDVGHKMIQ